MMYCKINFNVLVNYCLFILYTQYICLKQQITIHICKLANTMNGMSMIANEKMLAGYADSEAGYPDADPCAT